jgi:hypothetical protein
MLTRSKQHFSKSFNTVASRTKRAHFAHTNAACTSNTQVNIELTHFRDTTTRHCKSTLFHKKRLKQRTKVLLVSNEFLDKNDSEAGVGTERGLGLDGNRIVDVGCRQFVDISHSRAFRRKTEIHCSVQNCSVIRDNLLRSYQKNNKSTQHQTT